MRWHASRSLEAIAFLAATGLVAVLTATLSESWSRTQAGVATGAPVAAAEPNPFADRFPNVVLKTHEGKNVRFYDDLLKGKVVMMNFMYATCKGR